MFKLKITILIFAIYMGISAHAAFDIKGTSTGIRATFSNDMLFYSKTPALTDLGKKYIEGILKKIPLGNKAQVIVEAHTDSTAIKDVDKFRYPSNWELAASRASSVIRFVESKKLSNVHDIYIKSHADKSPIAPNFTTDGRRKNRRIVLELNYFATKKETIQIKEAVIDVSNLRPLVEKYLYTDIASCSDIEKEYLHTIYFEGKVSTVSKNQSEVVNAIANYIQHRGRLISVVVESHSSSTEDLLNNGKISIIRGNNVKNILATDIRDSIIKLIPYGNAINLTSSRMSLDSDINNRVGISVIRCLDRYKPIF